MQLLTFINFGRIKILMNNSYMNSRGGGVALSADHD